MMSFERARSREHKEERREEIMKAAADLLESTDYEKITLASIAEKLSFTRANLYKYVASKDEIFLWIVIKDVSLWVDDVCRTFSEDKVRDNEEFARLWTEIFCRHARVLRLFSLLNSLIERNVTVEKLAEFKRELFSVLAPLLDKLTRLLPGMSEKGLWDFLNMQLHYAAGLYPAVHVTDRQRQALELAGIEFEIPDFETDMTRFLTILLDGLS